MEAIPEPCRQCNVATPLVTGRTLTGIAARTLRLKSSSEHAPGVLVEGFYKEQLGKLIGHSLCWLYPLATGVTYSESSGVSSCSSGSGMRYTQICGLASAPFSRARASDLNFNLGITHH